VADFLTRDMVAKAKAYFGGREERLLELLVDDPSVTVRGKFSEATAAKVLGWEREEVATVFANVRRFMEGKPVVTSDSLRIVIARGEEGAIARQLTILAGQATAEVVAARRGSPYPISQAVRRLSMRDGSGTEDLDELVCIALAAIWCAFGKVDLKRRSPAKYFYRTAYNAVSDAIRAEARHIGKMAKAVDRFEADNS
jgi:hypothetical protein